MSSLVKLSKENLLQLRQLYEVEKPLHVATYVLIGHFLERFKIKPEWEEKVTFWTFNDHWKQTATFIMVNKNDRHIFFNTLEPWPYQSLHKSLQLLSYDEDMVFINFRDLFRPVVLDVIRVRNLEILFDTGTRCIYKPYGFLDLIDPINIEVDGYYFDSLNQSHVDKINSLWTQKYTGSHEFLSNCIAQNPSTGLFNKETGELVAWSIVLETGAYGNLQVLDKYHRQGFGEITALMHNIRVEKVLKNDMVGHIVHQNSVSFALATKGGLQWIDNNSWIGVRPKETQKSFPLWGHL